MQQHPVPQNVTSYQFRLIGDMTLTQFLELLAGGVVAYIIYSTNLIGVVKYFLMFISVILGVAFAFLPLEGRPLTQWTMAFIRAIYLPTQFYWEKKPKLPEYLSDSLGIKSPPTTELAPNTPPRQPLKEEPLIKEFEEQHSKRIEEIINLYKEVPIQSQSPVAATAKPTTTQSQSTTNTTPRTESVPHVITTKIEPIAIQTTTPQKITTTTLSQPSPQPQAKNQNKVLVSEQKPETQSLAVFNSSLPFPSVPETPNTLIGMVFDKTGNIIENAVVEIKNQSGTVRATKTNRLGQFFLATPLNSDSYSIYTEKEKFVFKPISLKLEGKIYPPLEIRATN